MAFGSVICSPSSTRTGIPGIPPCMAATYHHVPSSLRTTLQCPDSPSMAMSIFQTPGASLNSPLHIIVRLVVSTSTPFLNSQHVTQDAHFASREKHPLHVALRQDSERSAKVGRINFNSLVFPRKLTQLIS